MEFKFVVHVISQNIVHEFLHETCLNFKRVFADIGSARGMHRIE
jgi:hypothetical protein